MNELLSDYRDFPEFRNDALGMFSVAKGFDEGVVLNLANGNNGFSAVVNALLHGQAPVCPDSIFISQTPNIDPELLEKCRNALGDGGSGLVGSAVLDADHRISAANDLRGGRIIDTWSNGTSRVLNTHSTAGAAVNAGVAEVPIAIVGAGLAGGAMAKMLAEQGYNKVHLFEKKSREGGIWNQPNVATGSRNIPGALRSDNLMVSRAPGDVDAFLESGKTFADFVHASIVGVHDPRVVGHPNTHVFGIDAADFGHVLHYQEGDQTRSRQFPIVFYAPGNGNPINTIKADPSRIIFGEGYQPGQRWQKQFSPEELQKRHDSEIVIAGLGNSAAEVGLQLDMVCADYRVLTHYSENDLEAVAYFGAGANTSFARDTKRPTLTKLALDLVPIRDWYERAYQSGKIIGDVRAVLPHTDGVLDVIHGDQTTVLHPDRTFTLIGYSNSCDTNEAMGFFTTDSRTGKVLTDFDGEARDSQMEQIRGLFALGAVRAGENARVAAGIFRQVEEAATTTMIRAAEFLAMQ